MSEHESMGPQNVDPDADLARISSAPGATAVEEPIPRRERRPRSGERGDGSERDETSTTIGLLRALVGDLAELVRKEAALVRVELSEKVEQLQRAGVSMGVGAAVAYGGFLVLLFSAVAGLNAALDEPWLSALVVGALVTAVGLALAARGKRLAEPSSLVPERSTRSVKKDARLARDEAKRI